ncbi:sulfatase-like hydrolase/transferase, partial [Rhizobiaceae sp. 2RAB30]
MKHDKFPGSIGRTVAESTPWWPAGRNHKQLKPNILVVLLDDTGWADFGCFGSEIRTPVIDRLAGRGLRYTNFHVTPLCSPTRTSQLTGRN